MRSSYLQKYNETIIYNYLPWCKLKWYDGFQWGRGGGGGFSLPTVWYHPNPHLFFNLVAYNILGNGTMVFG